MHEQKSTEHLAGKYISHSCRDDSKKFLLFWDNGKGYKYFIYAIWLIFLKVMAKVYAL